MGILYIVATPIGNLEDFTFRALRILKEADVILCEDTRVTKKLLAHYKVDKPLLSYHQHSKEDKRQEILDLLLQDKNLALVTDAGTPGISDPGNELIAYLLKTASTKTKQLSNFCTIKVVPIPGPSALSALASVAGIPMDKFVFLGYPPHKKGRKKFFEEVAQSIHPVIFYESPHRILKTLEELNEILRKVAVAESHSVVVGRELTKQFETVYRGSIDSVLKQLEKEKPRGEFAIAVFRA
ncbi:MAG: 16S rRNA (cytidine(1402)-2'-O)-methyltransferase [Candidatus Wildermuthbacteria bacterium RIFCSPHIGHO2_02_FULL_47_12]|uniref:Ribosomal RNA small subunit methyltransferase I n=1 Tax=Candidatus Wildermuthbacteria bacterium RIFCSPHIGHO2_02_FULL_47_12 TaxID=1802451 RepID=A0A1G2R326_9BACT|nr:MAG: 16S rRNA (cytidine(1402)-2'-O)-methyltransferase [Candidatus Wildermuthbacteria bacterium RIFCSPHIGHO2_02_FULL_47_12]